MYKVLFDKLDTPAVLITDPMNMRYVSGFRGGEGALYLSKNKKVLITDSRYTEQATAETDFTVIEESSVHKRAAIINECMSEDGADTIAYEDTSMRCSELFSLQENVSNAKNWIRIKEAVDDLRRIKTPYEIKCMEEAAAIADKAFEYMLGIIKPGMTEKEGAALLDHKMKMLGAEKTSFDTIFASGVNSSMPHAIPSDKALETGDFLTMDFGCTIDGYCSDMTRTIVLGKASEKQKLVYNIVLEANKRALAAVKAGVKGCEIDAIARDYIRSMGYGEYFGHGLGHSVGLYIHENPRFSPIESSIIEANVTETVEPGIYLPGEWGIRIEDFIVVLEDGYKLLSHSNKELIEL